MLKQTKLNIEDTNMALFGSPLEKEIKKRAADGEPAWKTAGQKEGIEVWRVEKFKIKPWPKEQYGKFYDGDSYIVLHTYKQQDALRWDIHFWLGHYTTLDEAGTAAYKTVELDDHLNGTPVEHREVQGMESEAFLKYFHPFIIQSGGVDSGFKHVTASDYRKRLLHIKGTGKHVVIREVPAHCSSLNRGDVFMLDLGLKVITWVGPKAGIGEKTKATQFARALDDERGSKVEIQVIGEQDKDDHAKQFWDFLGGRGDIKETDGDDKDVSQHKRRMVKVHQDDASGDTGFSEVAYGKGTLKSDDVFIVDTVGHVFVWCGKQATAEERKFGFAYAQQYLNEQDGRDKTIPITKVLEGAENEEFHAHI